MIAAILSDQAKFHVVLRRHWQERGSLPPTPGREARYLAKCSDPQCRTHENRANDAGAKKGCGLGHEHTVVAITRTREVVSREGT